MDRSEVEQNVIRRIKVAEGQLKKVEQMVGEKYRCEEILAQTYSIKGALAKIDEIIIANHFKKCLCVELDTCKMHDKVVDEIVGLLSRRLS